MDRIFNASAALSNTGACHIRALNVKCNNLDNGCTWTGELRNLEIYNEHKEYDNREKCLTSLQED